MEHDEARAIRPTRRRMFRHVDGFFDPAVIDTAVESQGAESRVDEHPAFDALVIDDRDELRPQPHHSGPERERSEER